MNTRPTPLFVRVSDAKAVFGMSRQLVYDWAAAGKIKIHKRGGCAFLKVEEVANYIEGVGDQLGDQNGTQK